MAFSDEVVRQFRAARGDVVAQATVAAEFVLASRVEVDGDRLRCAFEAAVILHWFNVDLLAKMLNVPADDALARVGMLAAMPFVEISERLGERVYNVHEST